MVGIVSCKHTAFVRTHFAQLIYHVCVHYAGAPAILLNSNQRITCNILHCFCVRLCVYPFCILRKKEMSRKRKPMTSSSSSAEESSSEESSDSEDDSSSSEEEKKRKRRRKHRFVCVLVRSLLNRIALFV